MLHGSVLLAHVLGLYLRLQLQSGLHPLPLSTPHPYGSFVRDEVVRSVLMNDANNLALGCSTRYSRYRAPSCACNSIILAQSAIVAKKT